MPYLLRPLLWLRICKIRTDTDGFIDAWGASACEPDEAILQRPEVRSVFRQAFPEAVRQGPRAVLHETRLLAGSWGFDLSSIPVHVDLVHGGRDTFTPEPMVRYVGAQIPDSTIHMYPDSGHLLHYDYWDEILSTVTEG